MALGHSSEFVNREKQWIGFLKMINGETLKQIMIIEAPEQMGKTWLIQRMEHEVTRRAIPISLWDFTRDYPWDYLTLVRQARDRIGPEYFNHMTDIINEVTTTRYPSHLPRYSQVEVDERLDIDSHRDNFGTIQVDSDIVRRNFEMRITDAFIHCLDALSQGQRILFLMDAVEKTPNATMTWIVNHLLEQIRVGQLPNVLVVMAGQKTPKLDVSWNSWVGKTDLDMFTIEHIEELLTKYGSGRTLKPELRDISNEKDEPQRLQVLSEGHPGRLGWLISKMYIKQLKQEPAVDWM